MLSDLRFAVILGDEELAQGVAMVKDMTTGEQHPVAMDVLVDAVSPR